jgi:hypothetical protein
MNVVIIFSASGSGTITRELWEPKPFPLQDACNHLNRRPDLDAKIYELVSMMLEWAEILSQSYRKWEMASSECDPGNTRAVPDLAMYLGVCTSSLNSSLRTRLDPSYVDFHDRVLQFYPAGVSAETIKLESPFPLADIEAPPTRQKTHDLKNSLQVKEYSPMGLDDDQTAQLHVVVWYAGGKLKPICVG